MNNNCLAILLQLYQCSAQNFSQCNAKALNRISILFVTYITLKHEYCTNGTHVARAKLQLALYLCSFQSKAPASDAATGKY